MPDELGPGGGPAQAEQSTGEWRLLCASASVLRDWERLKKLRREAMAACEVHIKTNPLLRRPGRVYPWRGRDADGRWEFEVTGGDRVLYRVNVEERSVVILFAGPHPPGRYPR